MLELGNGAGVRIYDEAINLDPNNGEILRRAKNLYEEEGRTKKAMKVSRRLKNINSKANSYSKE